MNYRAAIVVVAALIVGGPWVASPSYADAFSEFVRCQKKTLDQDACLELLGRNSWYPEKVDQCYAVRDILRFAVEQGWELSWKILFFNERCARLEMPHFAS